MRNLVKYCAVVALLLFVPALAQADSQCTTTELDLMCDPGYTLEGIDQNGQKHCVPKGFGGAFVEKVHVVVTTNCGGGNQHTETTGSCEITNSLDEQQRCSCPAGFQSVLISESRSNVQSQRVCSAKQTKLVSSYDAVMSFICQPYGR